jgi:type I restriction enzyme, R subunit
VSSDTVLASGWDAQADEAARATVTSFQQFIADHRDEILALQVLLDRPANTRIDLKEIKSLARAIKAPPLGLTTDRLWQAYATLDQARVYSAGERRLVTDLIALVRYATVREQDENATLEPFALQVCKRFDSWLAEQEQRSGSPFTEEQQRWLELMREHIISSLSIEQSDFDLPTFAQQGGLGKAAQLFGNDLTSILDELNTRLIA